MKTRYFQLLGPRVSYWGALAACVAIVSPLNGQSEETQIIDLDAVFVKGLAQDAGDRLMAVDVVVSSVYGDLMSQFDIPRTVSFITREAFEQYNLQGFEDLTRATAGSAQNSEFGLIGTPKIRGDRAGVFFYGMERPFIGNKVPISFGAFETMEIIKGVAPAHFAATAPGGVVNLIPKIPFFTESEAKIAFTVGSYDKFRMQADVGNPFSIAGKRAAYRLSATIENSRSYYQHIQKDFVSVYGSVAVEFKPEITTFVAAEYYNFKTNENAGWNRVTQDLIDRGVYIRGEALNLVDNTNFHGTAARATPRAGKPVASTSNPNGTVPDFWGGLRPGQSPSNNRGALVVPDDLLASLSAEQRATLLEINGEWIYTSDYLAGPDGIPFTADDGTVATTKIRGSQVLSDPNDYANSEGAFFYADWVNGSHPSFTHKNKFFIEAFRAKKLSSYNYANETDQLVAEYRFQVEQKVDKGIMMNFLYGASARYNYGSRIADAWPETFSRRDLSNPVITGNSVILSGPQAAKGGTDWYQGGDKTDLYVGGVFGTGQFFVTEKFSTVVAARYEWNQFKTHRPNNFYMRNPGSLLADGNKNFWNISISPNLNLSNEFSLYVTAHKGASIMFGNSGTILGKGNFADTELLEGGLKFSLLDSRLQGSFAAYYSEREKYDDQAGEVTPYRSKGFEFEANFALNDRLSVTTNLTYQRQNARSAPGFRATDTFNGYLLPLIAGAGYWTSGPDIGLVAQNNPELHQPATPETVWNLLMLYRDPSGFGFAAGPTYMSGFYINWERTLHTHPAWIFNANAFYETGKWKFMLHMTNITSEDYFFASEFAANMVITKAPPMQMEFTASYRF